MNTLFLPPPLNFTRPHEDLHSVAERIASQPRPHLSDAEIDAWALALAKDVAGADD